jgi:protocatechuate 3,4-dioxygenase, alpha subunit
MKLVPTSWQTVGPFFSIGLERLCNEQMVAADAEGERVTIAGHVLDGDGVPVPDALLEIWQADVQGIYARHSDLDEAATEGSRFGGFGRVATNESGQFRFVTIKPGCVKGANGRKQAPHLLVSIFMRGLLTRLVTRIYFPKEPINADDEVLSQVPAERRGTLLAKASSREDNLFEWNVVLQGPNETVFFAC